MYNLTFMDNVTDITEVVQGANTYIAEGMFFIILLFALAIIAMISLWRTDFKTLSIAVWFGIAVLSGLFWGLSLVPFYIVGIVCSLLFISIFIKFIRGD